MVNLASRQESVLCCSGLGKYAQVSRKLQTSLPGSRVNLHVPMVSSEIFTNARHVGTGFAGSTERIWSGPSCDRKHTEQPRKCLRRAWRLESYAQLIGEGIADPGTSLRPRPCGKHDHDDESRACVWQPWRLETDVRFSRKSIGGAGAGLWIRQPCSSRAYGKLGNHMLVGNLLHRSLVIREREYGSDHTEVRAILFKFSKCHVSDCLPAPLKMRSVFWRAQKHQKTHLKHTECETHQKNIQKQTHVKNIPKIHLTTKVRKQIRNTYETTQHAKHCQKTSLIFKKFENMSENMSEQHKVRKHVGKTV
jgi:hypothetical protein